MIFKIPSTNNIYDIYFESSKHTSFNYGSNKILYIYIYKNINPRINNNAEPYRKFETTSFKFSNSINIETNTEYYIQFSTFDYNGKYENSILFYLAKYEPIEINDDNIYTVTSLLNPWLKFSYVNTSSIYKNTLMFFHVFINNKFDFNYTDTCLYYDQIKKFKFLYC